MIRRLSPDVLQELGLSESEVGPAETLASADHAAHGRAAPQPISARALPEQEYQSVIFPCLQELGVRTEVSVENPLLFALHAPKSDAWQRLAVTLFRPQRAEDDVLYVSEDDPCTAFVDLGGVELVRFDLGAKVGCVVGKEAGAPIVYPLRRDASVDLQTPAASWVDASADPWLHDLVTGYASSRAVWKRAVAATLSERLRSYPAAEISSRVARLLAGEVDDALARPRVWAQNLPSAQQAWLEEQALAEVDSLATEMEALLEEPMPADDAWVSAVRDLLYRRDDLEAVRLTLRFVDRADRLERLLESLDREGELFAVAIPRANELTGDERLNRLLRYDPDAWWALPALT